MFSSNSFSNVDGDIGEGGCRGRLRWETFCDLQLSWSLLLRLPQCSIMVPLLFPSLSLSFSCERPEVTMYSDWHRCSFGAQLLKDKTCVLRNNQMNPQLAQGSRRDLRADQGADSIFLGSSIPITLRARPRTSGPLPELSVSYWLPRPVF